MTTATRRLRRASVAGLATAVTALGIIASAGPAGAAITGATLQTPTATNVFPGQNAQAVPNVTFTIPDASGAGWANGDFITFNLSTAITPAPATCNTGSSSTRTASFTAKPTIAGVTNGTTAFAGFTVAQGSTAACSVQDQFTVNFTAGAPADTNSTVFTISGMSVSLGAGVPTGNLDLATAVNGLSAALAPTGVKLATIGANSVTVTPVVGAANASAGVAISPIVATDVTGGTMSVNVVFTLAGGDVFATAGTLTAPSGVTITGPSQTLPSATLTYTIAAGTVPAGGKFTLTGSTVNLAGGGLSHKVTVTSNAVTVGAATEFATTAAEVRTFAGVDRYGTARALYHAGFPAATSAVIASGVNFPDALSSEILAKAHATGVLLTDPNTLSQDTQQELQADPIATVYIVGGTAAVSQNVQNAIAAMHVNNVPANGLINVVRIAGADRYATNNAVDLTAGAGATIALISTGANFADALAVGPVAYGGTTNFALVLTDPATLSSSASSTLVNLGITHAIILGGVNAVSANVETQLKTAGVTTDYRIAGADRTATAAMIATWAVAGLPASGTYAALALQGFAAGVATAFLTRGDLFADALASGPVGGLQKHVLVLSSDPTSLGAGAATYLGGKAGTITTISTLGFASAVSPAVVTAAVAALG